MNLLHLQYFYVVAKEGGFSKASRELRVNQPSLSRMVKLLESQLNIVLLERHPRGVQLTARGEEIFRQAAEIFERVDQLKRNTGQLSQICQGELRLGATDAISKHLLVRPLRRMAKDWEAVYPIVQTGTAGELLSHVAGGRLEFGLFFHLPQLPRSLAVTQRWPLRFHLVAARKEARSSKIRQRFIGSREVDDDFNRHFPTLSKWKKVVPEAHLALSSNSLLLHRELVLAGLGISVLPSFLIDKDLKARRMVDLLPKEHLQFDLKLVHRKNVGLSLNATTFLRGLDREPCLWESLPPR
jgi:DNA-binding transcriptional LysR family regulator